MRKLKKCPFCGKDVKMEIDDINSSTLETRTIWLSFIIRCSQCGCEKKESGKVADKLRGGRLHRTRNIETPPTLSNDFEISRRKAARIAGELMQGDEVGEVLPLLQGYRIEQKGAFFNEIDGHFYIRIFLVCDDKGRARTCTNTARSKKRRSGKTGRS